MRLISGLIEAGVRVTVASDTRPTSAWLSRTGFSWVHVPAWRGNRLRRLLRLGAMGAGAVLRSPAKVGSLRNSLRRRRDRLAILNHLLPLTGRHWDVIYFPWNSSAIDHLPLFEQGVPIVVSCRGSQVNIAPHNPERSALHSGLRETFRKAAAVHCVSENIRRQAVRFGLDYEKARVIRPAVDLSLFTPPPARPARTSFTVVTTGTLIWRKGLEYALVAVRRLVDGGVDVCLEIIGDGPDRQRSLYTIHDLELTGRVLLRGRLQPDGVREHLQRADAFLLASLSEGISNAVLEAMACGLPVVTTDCGGMAEAVTDGVEGFVVPKWDAVAIARALRKLAADPELRRRMGEAGRRRIEREFRLDAQVNAFVELFRSVARGEDRTVVALRTAFLGRTAVPLWARNQPQ